MWGLLCEPLSPQGLVQQGHAGAVSSLLKTLNPLMHAAAFRAGSFGDASFKLMPLQTQGKAAPLRCQQAL